MPADPFKIAVIGAGKIATQCHGPALQKYARENPGVELAACCDLDPGRARAFQDSFGFRRTFTEVDEMLAAESPGAVLVLVSEPVACRVAVPLLERGIPTLLEKPPGMNVGETRRLIAAAAKGRGPNAVALNRRSMPLVTALRDRVREAGVDLTQIRYEMIRSGRTENYFFVTAIHGLDLVLQLAASPLVESRLRRQAPAQAPAGAFQWEVDAAFASGLRAQWLFSPMAGVVFERVSAHGWGHSFYASLPVVGSFDAVGSVEHYVDNRCVWRVSGTELCPGGEPFMAGGFFAEAKEFLDRVRQGIPQRHPLETALESMRFAEAFASGQERFPA